MGDHNKTVQTIARCLSVSATIKTIGATVLLIYSFSVDSWLTQTDVLEYTVNDATFTARASLGLFNQCVECISTQCPDPALPANVKICEPVNSIPKCTACPNGAFALALTMTYVLLPHTPTHDIYTMYLRRSTLALVPRVTPSGVTPT